MLQADFPDFDPLEFRDRHGVVRQSWGYSPVGRSEFWQRLLKLHEQVEAELEHAKQLTPNVPLAALICRLYESEHWFRHNCNRCLLLNGIEPDWIDGRGVMITGLLFEYEGSECLLIRLNSPDSSTKPAVTTNTDEPIGSVYDTIAALAIIEGSYREALQIASEIPEKHVNRYLKARAELSKPKDNGQQAFDEWAKKQRSQDAFSNIIDLNQYKQAQ
jgi:hypothetical protein